MLDDCVHASVIDCEQVWWRLCKASTSSVVYSHSRTQVQTTLILSLRGELHDDTQGVSFYCIRILLMSVIIDTLPCSTVEQLTQCKDTDPCHPALLRQSCSSLTPMPYANSRREHSNDISWDEGIPGVAKFGFRRFSITLETITTDSLGDIELEWVANITWVNQVGPSKRSGTKIISKLYMYVKDIECSRIC